VAAANIKGHYSYIHHYISTLGVPAWGRFAYLMNGAFYVEGALLFVGAVLVVRAVGRVPVYTILAWQIFSGVVLHTRQAARHVD
jgi:hypothetical membrane protein